MPLEIVEARPISAPVTRQLDHPMSCFTASDDCRPIDCREEKLECFGPLALRLLAIAAGAAIFVPLVAAFAAPFFG